VKERGIIMQADSVRGILAGRKTQTRRLVKWPRAACLHGRSPLVERTFKDGPKGAEYIHCAYSGGDLGDDYQSTRVFSPYGEPGDRLWVRESWRHVGAPSEWTGPTDIRFAASVNEAEWAISEWRPSSFMPRWASRLTLDVPRIRIERLQEITEEDAIAEGIQRNIGRTHFCGAPHRVHGYPRQHNTAREAYADLWDLINGARARWATNPWVWAIDFKVADAAKVRAV
jgi:hypothetical protein